METAGEHERAAAARPARRPGAGIRRPCGSTGAVSLARIDTNPQGRLPPSSDQMVAGPALRCQHRWSST
jgi:hypothetical protein